MGGGGGGSGGTQPGPELPEPGCNSTRAPAGSRPLSPEVGRMTTVCTGGESPEVRRENDEFEALLTRGGLGENALGDFAFECTTGFEPDCSPEQKLAARLSQIGPAAVNWLFTLGGDAYWAIKSNLTWHNATTTVATASIVFPIAIAAPEGVAGAGVYVTAARWAHVVNRHFAGSRAVNASKFLGRFSNEAGVTGLLTAALKTPGTVIEYVNKVGTWQTVVIRTVQMEQSVGFDLSNGNVPTNFFTVMTSIDGMLITLFPGFASSGWRLP